MTAARVFPKFFVDSKNSQRQLGAALFLLAEYNHLTLMIDGLHAKLDVENKALDKLVQAFREKCMGFGVPSMKFFLDNQDKKKEVAARITPLEDQRMRLFNRKYEIRSAFCPLEKDLNELNPEIGRRVSRLISFNPGTNKYV